MKRISSQVIVALVCCILGFMLAYQFRMLTKYQKKQADNKSASDITVENEMFKKEKTEMQKKIDELQMQIKKYEEAAGSSNESNKQIVNELERTRMLVGETEVEGPGLNVYIKPISNIILGSNVEKKKITDQDLVLLINELRFAGAEAISINNYRITSRTGIKISGGANSFIVLDGQRKISQDEQITITAIGNKELLWSTISFRGALNIIPSYAQGDCEIKYEKSDKLKIPSSNMPMKFEYAKPVKK